MVMKTVFMTAIFFGLMQGAYSQLKKSATCPAFMVDVLYGKLNDGLNPQSTIGEIQKYFPCFTDLQETPAPGKCAGIFYRDKDIYFYTGRDYIELGPKFKGKLSIPLMGASRKGLFKTLGNPVMKDAAWDAFHLRYGTLVLYYNKAGRVNKMQISNMGPETLKPCD
jgi:hypothetical protein